MSVNGKDEFERIFLEAGVRGLEGTVTDIEDGKSYWLNFSDGSRIRCVAQIDGRGDIDMVGEVVENYLLWVGRNGEPVNRHGLLIEAVK